MVDASVLLKLLLPEKESEAVRRQWSEWLEQDAVIAAPFLLAYDVVSVLRYKVFRGELPQEAGEAAFLAFQAQEISLLHPEGIEERAWGLARQWNLPTAYDAAYLALAELLTYEFWTADRRLVATLRKKMPRMRVIPS
ncbi:MAG TPA: type II toxin-antitoxin system VapC family toxin [Candidatus Methylomirabilis sp.]|nr:type II toxin-antitoxin system VapC family toxin [Candidatus Methylomirabilis sp.]